MKRTRIGAAALIIVGAWAIAAVLVFAEETEDEQPPAGAAGARAVTPALPPLHTRFGVRPASEQTPVRVGLRPPPRAGLLFDVDSGRVLWQLHPRRRLPIASLTKMLTALIIVERHRPGERVAITRRTLAYRGSGVGVLPLGKRVRLDALLYGLLLVSGNDAAIALAQHDAGTVRAFVTRMNLRAQRLGLACSRFSSPSGIHDRDNFSCPLDLATLARADLANRWLRRVVAMDRARFRFPIKGGFLDLFNNNPFIGETGITGLKTGLTDAAGRCYVITRRIGGHHLGVVLLNSPDPLRQVPLLLRAGAEALASAG
jgi:serine-type D-Ala-D-Ala carboxypeptidase (penicillin-binding protein 5/6)